MTLEKSNDWKDRPAFGATLAAPGFPIKAIFVKIFLKHTTAWA